MFFRKKDSENVSKGYKGIEPYWKKLVSWVVLITFSSSLISPVFATSEDQLIEQKLTKEGMKQEGNDTKLTTLRSNKKISPKNEPVPKVFVVSRKSKIQE